MNKEIGNILWQKFEANRKIFLSNKKLHPLFEYFKPFISKIDIEELSLKFESEVDNNISEWWTNEKKEVDLESKILAILFTHRDLCSKNPEALVYGINKTDSPLKKTD